MDTSDLANRMKEYEKRNQYYLQKRTPVAIRVDGRNFHTFTKGFKRPFDNILIKSMQETAKYMCENIQGAKFAYVQSDEITIILVDYDTLKTDCWFNYRTDKLCSISASMATMAFNKFFSTEVSVLQAMKKSGIKPNISKDYIDILLKAEDKGAMFDARCFNIPKEEVTNCIYWRQLDASRNSIQMVGQANFSHKELHCKTCNNIQDMLMLQKNINWNDFPTYQKRGTCVVRNKIILESNGITKTAILRDASKSENEWIIDKEIPIFKGEGRDYIEQLINYIEEE